MLLGERMRILVITDIHANYRALKAVLGAFGSVDEVWCLGDVLSCGPCPQQCIDLVRETCRHVVRGNHDISESAGGMVGAATMEYLLGLPLSSTVAVEGQSYRLVHGSPSDPLSGSLRPDTDRRVLARELEQCNESCVLCGHTHMAMLLELGGKTIVNAGTVGQPRDGDYRAQCTLIEEGRFRFERVEYDLDALATDYQRSAMPEEAKRKWLRDTRRGIVEEHGLQLGPFSPQMQRSR
jgi:putative phosphoesterase